MTFFLALPTGGNVVVQAIPGLTLPTRKHAYRLHYTDGEPGSFNWLWCRGLNERSQYGFRYFMFHHSDISAPPEWADVLIDEAERTGADVLSVVVPIKDDRNLQSCGVRNLDTGKTRRLTAQELARLPETFGIEAFDTLESAWGGEQKVIIVNNGLLCVRFDASWVEEVCWGFRESNAFEDGVWRNYYLGEDWNFSQWAIARGLKVMATKKIVPGHHGKKVFRSDDQGGLTVDRGDEPRC